MSQAQQNLIKIIEQVYRDTGAPATTVAVAMRWGMSDRNTRRHLNAIKQTGLIKRMGQRKGWLPVVASLN